jgi:deoxyhypusine synthase
MRRRRAMIMKKTVMRKPTRLGRQARRPDIRGYDFEQPFDLEQFFGAYATTGFQATHLARGRRIIDRMLEKRATIYLSMTSNVISSGLRDVIAFLAKHQKVQVIVTSAGGVEEDLLKCFGPFKVGFFDAPPKALLADAVARIGNIFVPDDGYSSFRGFLTKVFERLYRMQKELKRPLAPSEILRQCGLSIANESSYLYWAAKNGIPVYCPGLVDGAIGDFLYYFMRKHENLAIDVLRDHRQLIDLTRRQKKTGLVLLGGGTAKHYVLNANIFRDGADLAVYITTGTEHDGSDSGGNPEEAMTWEKIKCDADVVKIVGDVTIIFPLLVAGTGMSRVVRVADKVVATKNRRRIR